MATTIRSSKTVTLVCVLLLVAGAVVTRAGGALEQIDITAGAPSPIPGHILAKLVGIRWDTRAIPVKYSMNTTLEPDSESVAAESPGVDGRPGAGRAAGLLRCLEQHHHLVHQDADHGHDGQPGAARLRLRQRADLPDRRQLHRHCLVAIGELHRRRHPGGWRHDRQRSGLGCVRRHHGGHRRRRRRRSGISGGVLQGRHDSRQRRAVQRQGQQRLPLHGGRGERWTPSPARSIWERWRCTSSAIRTACRTRSTIRTAGPMAMARRCSRSSTPATRPRSWRSGRSTSTTSPTARTSIVKGPPRPGRRRCSRATSPSARRSA